MYHGLLNFEMFCATSTLGISWYFLTIRIWLYAVLICVNYGVIADEIWMNGDRFYDTVYVVLVLNKWLRKTTLGNG